MSYMWNDFNIKTFAAETIVYRDGKYCPELSTIKDGPIDKKYDLPVHIIYTGEIAGKCRLNIEINVAEQDVFLSADIKSKKPAFLNIFIKNAGKNSNLRGHVMIENACSVNFDCTGRHLAPNTGILVQTKLYAHRDTVSVLSGHAVIEKDAVNAASDIGFSAMAERGARMEFNPAQKISAVPISAEHSAAIYTPSAPQILYLREAGLSGAECEEVTKEAFRNDFSLF